MSAAHRSGEVEDRQGGIPGGIWALGFVSLLMDVSSEMIHSLLPVFLVTVLGASTVMVGVIEGVGEATASISKLFSGWLSDRLGRRKGLTVAGYGLGALSKPLFAIAPTASWVLGARFTDCLGKGIRGAPRDALVGDLAPPGVRGAAYGLRQSLDTVGAFAGPLLAIGLMELFDDAFRLVFWLAVLPAISAVVVLVVGVHEPAGTRPASRARLPLRWTDVRRLSGRFWAVVAVGFVLTLARFSEAFLILRAEEAGLPIALLPLVLVVMNVVYAASAYPVGALSDRVDRRLLLAIGFAVLILADVVLAVAPGILTVMLGVGLWGLHMGMTQGLFAALVADVVPADVRGTGFGLFHLASGVALLLASLVAGMLWAFIGAPATFLAGAIMAASGLIGGAVALRRNRRRMNRPGWDDT
jgi:MFS family permease